MHNYPHQKNKAVNNRSNPFIFKLYSTFAAYEKICVGFGDNFSFGDRFCSKRTPYCCKGQCKQAADFQRLGNHQWPGKNNCK